MIQGPDAKTLPPTRACWPLAHAAALLALAPSAGSCDSSQPLPITVVLPEDASDIERADNAALVLMPEGAVFSFDITSGLEFELQLEVENPDEQNRTVELYLARGSELLAWGRSAPFVTLAPTDGLAMFVGRPGALSTYPGRIEAPEPDVLAAEAAGRGIVLLGSDGSTYLWSVFTLDTSESVATLEDAPDPANGALVSDAAGGVIRLQWDDALVGHRFDPGTDTWSALDFEVDGDLGPRAHAAHVVDAARERVLLFGGGTPEDAHKTIARIDLLADPDLSDTSPVHRVKVLPDFALDGPRMDAHVTWMTREGTDAGEALVLSGTPEPDTGVIAVLPTTIENSDGDGDDADVISAIALGPTGPWENLRCVQVDRGSASTDDVPVRVLCAGGLRGEGAEPTADGVLLKFPPGDARDVSVEELPGVLNSGEAEPVPVEDLRWFADSSAVYAQTGGLLFTFGRHDPALSAAATQSPALRARGGHSVKLSTGATFLLGGETVEGTPVDRWQVFTPAVETPE